MKTHATIMTAILAGLLVNTTIRAADAPQPKPPADLQPAEQTANPSASKLASDNDRGLRLNFRGVPGPVGAHLLPPKNR